MSSTEDTRREASGGWEQVGRAAEDFARRVARDAGRFAERLQEHSSELAHDVARDWRRARRRHRHWQGHSCRAGAADDVRRVFEDIRGVVAGVLDGIDDLIDTVFAQPAAEPPADWEKIVSNREVSCIACGRPVAVGDEAYLQRRESAVEYRCQSCGPGTQGSKE
ncbi:MAG: hypothetical protein HY270_03115 [Deltaproteobacteria bacterium]|nr:hypothetical protein [Deltaproteobacteria bacterium]